MSYRPQAGAADFTDISGTWLAPSQNNKNARPNYNSAMENKKYNKDPKDPAPVSSSLLSNTNLSYITWDVHWKLNEEWCTFVWRGRCRFMVIEWNEYTTRVRWLPPTETWKTCSRSTRGRFNKRSANRASTKSSRIKRWGAHVFELFNCNERRGVTWMIGIEDLISRCWISIRVYLIQMNILSVTQVYLNTKLQS